MRNTHLPDNDPSFLGPQEEHMATECDAADALGKVGDSFLIPLGSHIDVDGRLVLLSSKDMSVAQSQSATRNRALLQDGRGRMGGVKGMFVYACIFRDGGVVGQWRP